MNITILSNQDVASNFALNLLLPLLQEHKVSLFLSSKVGGNGNRPAQLLRLKFFEQTLFNDLLSPLLDKQDDSSDTFKSFAQLSSQLSEPFRVLNNINTAEGLEILQETAPDLIISIRYGVILRDPVIQIPRYGVINLHSGLLPDYRGVMASFWALLNEEKNIGCTLHYIDNSTIDTGQIIATTHLAVDPNRSYLWHVLNLYIQGVEKIAQSAKEISSAKKLESIEQTSTGNYYTFPTQKELAEFEARGLNLVNEDELTDFFKRYYY